MRDGERMQMLLFSFLERKNIFENMKVHLSCCDLVASTAFRVNNNNVDNNNIEFCKYIYISFFFAFLFAFF